MFPSALESPFSKVSLEQKKRLAPKIKRLTFRAEAEELTKAKEKREAEAEAKNEPMVKDPYILALLNSSGFKSWFEEITGRDATQWVKSMCLISSIYIAEQRVSLDFIVRERLFTILDRHKWKNPGYRRYWVDQIKNCTCSRKRRSIVLRLATPKWADPLKMAQMYRRRDELTLLTGITHHVDHIVPLQGRLVCGLNWEGNMQVITASDNLEKSNKFCV